MVNQGACHILHAWLYSLFALGDRLCLEHDVLIRLVAPRGDVAAALTDWQRRSRCT
jgi:hypothetical protein